MLGRDYKAEIGKRIGKARRSKHLTQEKLAESLGIETNSLSNIERGAKGFSVEILIKLCELLEVDANYIISGRYTVYSNRFVNHYLEKMSSHQTAYIEDMIALYARSCGIE